MILIDDTGHLASTTSDDELHTFARMIGLRREWYQNHPTHPHYDCTTAGKRAMARKFGAVHLPCREMLYRMAEAGRWQVLPGTLEILRRKYGEVKS